MMETAFRGLGRSLCITLALVSCMGAQPPVVHVFHPDAPLPSYEVAVIKQPDPAMPYGTTVRRFIQQAYGGARATMVRMDRPPAIVQVIGGPEWIDKDLFRITGKPSEQDRVAMDKMTPEERRQRTEMMDQSLLAERFHLKVHFETRDMPVFELVPGKHGLKITAVEPDASGGPTVGVRGDGAMQVRGKAISMTQLIGILQSHDSINGRPIIDETGFTGYFDVPSLKLPPTVSASDAAAQSDSTDLSTELEETLGVRLVAAKAPVEVVVIDSINRPTEN